MARGRGVGGWLFATALALGLLLAAGAAPASASAGGELRAGAANVDITPPVGTPMFAYTARSGLANPPRLAQILADPDPGLHAKTFEPSRGIHTRLRASAIVLERGDRRFALVSADLGGLPYTLLQEVARRVSHTGIGLDDMLVAATHTHAATGPIWSIDNLGYAVLGGDVYDSRIFEVTAQGIAESIELAAQRLEPALAGVAQVEVEGASRNRSFEPHLHNHDVPEDPEEAREQSIEPTLTAIRVDSADGRAIGLWTSFAVHPTSLGDGNLHFSGDNVATAQRVVENALRRAGRENGQAAGAPSRGPAPVNVWVNGAGGDVSPDATPDEIDGEIAQYTPTEYARASLVGERVGEGALRAWERAGEELSTELPIESRRKLTAFDGRQADGEPVGPFVALGFGGIFGPDGACAPFDGMAGPGQGQKMPLLVAPGLPGVGLITPVASVSVWQVGDVGLAALPFEVTTQMGRRISRAVEAEAGGDLTSVAIAGLANGYLSYVATPEEYDACHYEGSFTLFGRQQGARLRDVAVSLVGPLLNGAPPPRSALEPPAISPGSGAFVRPRATPQAGEVAEEPAGQVRRTARASFAWRGGDAIVDPPRGLSLVQIERRAPDGTWRHAGSDDSPTTMTSFSHSERTWTHTWQLGECTPTGEYRFVANGQAVRRPGADPEPYRVASRPFEVRETEPLEVLSTEPGEPGTTILRALYPDPGDSLIHLPRITEIEAPQGAERAQLTDRCGNPVRG